MDPTPINNGKKTCPLGWYVSNSNKLQKPSRNENGKRNQIKQNFTIRVNERISIVLILYSIQAKYT